MTQEQKQLLLKDLCARLPYGVKVRYVEDLVVKKESHIIILNNIYLEHILNGDADIKPYLRLMASMTEEEKEEFCYLQDMVIYNTKGLVTADVNTYVDWLLSHHFDFRDLIKMGLALEVPKDMYKTE